MDNLGIHAVSSSPMRRMPSILGAALLVGVLLSARPALACRFTVRDVGFIDVGQAPSTVFLCVRGDGGALAAAAREAAGTALRDSTVRLEVLDPDRDPEGTVARRLRAAGTTLPAFVLQMPAGIFADLKAPAAGATAGDIAAILETAVRSPARDALVASAVDAHSAIIVIEGTDPVANRRAFEIAGEAVAWAKEELADLPEPAPKSPLRAVIALADRDRERVLLAGLGIEGPAGPEAGIAILIGRLRRLGGLFAVPGAEREDLLDVLALVGLDCSCGLDRRWMRGPTVPHRWGPGEREAAAKRLAFDPESPRVRTEVAWILSRGPGSELLPEAMEGQDAEIDEILASGDAAAGSAPPPTARPEASAPAFPGPPSPSSGAPPGATGPAPGLRPGSPLRTTFLVLGALGVLALAAGTVVLLRSRRAP
jgi:hypothetical protein